MNNNNINEEKLNELLQTASKKMNISPEELRKRLEEKNMMGKLGGANAGMLNQALSNPKMAEKILASPKAQAILGKLMSK